MEPVNRNTPVISRSCIVVFTILDQNYNPIKGIRSTSTAENSIPKHSEYIQEVFNYNLTFDISGKRKRQKNAIVLD